MLAPPLEEATVSRRRGGEGIGGAYRVLGWAFLATVVALLYVPLVILVVFSFNDSIIIALPFKRFTLTWYAQLLRDPNVLGALRNSFLLASIVTPVSLFLGTLAAVSITRYRYRSRALIAALIAAPLVVPDLLIGVGALLFFHRVNVTLSLRTIFVMHVVDFFPVVTAIVAAQLFRFDRSLEEAAIDLGAAPLSVLRRVIFPMLGPALGASAVIVFSWSFNDFVVAFFTAGFQQTFPIWVFATLRHAANLPVVNAIATLVTAGQVGLLYLAWRFGKRWARRGTARQDQTLLSLTGLAPE